ncbi:PEP-CTERM sorting domain-containing protein [Sedimentisphaera salicampi]|uniref:PEP-CTERM sorting domain-containing protein n=1 Tax=Sedimentisphaera salicampi TaxID=1941349 RepID=UPI000B9BC5D5|nr:PEP-CTERM sorting domain-containing protein [Sedimentisphaera salicampi]OXU15122.1 hypothetical protein SMSP1_01052 [Sedimentisphaera salicampi]
MRNLLILTLAIFVSPLCWASFVSDNFEDGAIGNGPGSWSGDIDTANGWQVGGEGYGHHPGLAATATEGARMDLDFGGNYSTVEVDFEIRQENGSDGWYEMQWGFKTDAGEFAMSSGPRADFYNSAYGIASYDENGALISNPSDAGGGLDYLGQKLPTSGYQHFKLVFDGSESNYAVRVYTEDNNDGASIDESKGFGDLAYVSYYEQPTNGSAWSASGFFWENKSGAVTWQVDDVLVTPEPATLSLLGIGSCLLYRKRKR